MHHVHAATERQPARLWVAVVIALLATALLHGGCSGGMIGTSTGPTNPGNSVAYLPRKVSPRIPSSLLASSQSSSTTVSANAATLQSRNFNLTRITTQANTTTSAQTAASWQQLSPLFTRIETTRVALQLELLLLDSIFAEVINTCNNETDAVCRIAAGELEAEFTPALESRLASLLADDLATTSDSASVQLELMAIRDLISPGDTLTFSALSYQPLTRQPYAYRLQLDSLQLIPDTMLVIDWSTDFTDVAYQLLQPDGSNNNRYLYQDLASAQQLTLRDSNLPFLESNDDIVLEITAGKSNLDEILFTAKYALSTVTGRATDTRAFTSITDYTFDQQLFLQESFGNAGEVLEFLSCAFTDFDEDCLDEDLLESELFISEEDFDRTLEEYGVDDVRILNLPAAVRDFEILEALDGVPLDERDVLCEGWQAPFDNDIEIFCFADPQHIAEGVVVYYDEADNIIVVEQAEILVDADAATAASRGRTTQSR